MRLRDWLGIVNAIREPLWVLLIVSFVLAFLLPPIPTNVRWTMVLWGVRVCCFFAAGLAHRDPAALVRPTRFSRWAILIVP
jgi:hypothetical protein